MPKGKLAALALAAVVGGSLVVPFAPAARAGAVGAASNGFTHERVFSGSNDDWEPAIAADASGHVYVLTTRYGAQPACRVCPKNFIAIRTSSDGGATWSEAGYLCRCPGFSAQYDPEIVTDASGRVFAVWMNEFRVSFARSDDLGKTWTKYHTVDGNLAYTDKPAIAVSADGQDVYIGYNANYGPPAHGTPYAAYSHDAGTTWSEPVKMVTTTDRRYYYNGGATVLPDGTVLFAEDAYHQDNLGTVKLYVLRSRDGGVTWDQQFIGTSSEARACPRGSGCQLGYFGSQIAVATDPQGRAYVVYNASTEPRGPARLLFRMSGDGGDRWSPSVDVGGGAASVDHGWPMIAAAGNGDVRIGWMDDRTGWWNTFTRRSTDGGATWGSETRLSDLPAGAPYKSHKGFRFPYGDYGQLAIDGRGLTQAAWGEGPSYTGPGGTWYARGS